MLVSRPIRRTSPGRGLPRPSSHFLFTAGSLISAWILSFSRCSRSDLSLFSLCCSPALYTSAGLCSSFAISIDVRFRFSSFSARSSARTFRASWKQW